MKTYIITFAIILFVFFAVITVDAIKQKIDDDFTF